MASTALEPSPLVLLLEGVHCQRREQVDEARRQIQALLAAQSAPVEKCLRRGLSEAVRFLLAYHPELAATMSPVDMSLPLHHAAALGIVAVAAHLLEKFPQASSIPNKKGKIPLHFAAREGRTAMVRLLLASDPVGAAIRSKKSKLALHFAAGEGHISIVKLLLEVYPEGALIRTSKGKLPLHFAARWGHLDVAMVLLRLYPDSIQALDSDGSLPLHDAAREGQIATAMYLYRSYPRGLMTANLRNEIPLFPAVRRGNVDLVIALIQAWPAGGKFVLKHACIDDNVRYWSRDILELLLRGAVGNLVKCRILQGRRAPPLCFGDSVLFSGGDESAEPEGDGGEHSRPPDHVSGHGSFERPTKRRRANHLESTQGEFLPLHAALSCGASCDVVAQVLDKFPDQLSIQDSHGRLPLHVAMAHCRGEKMVELVVQKILKPYPKAVMARDSSSGHFPLHVGLMCRAEFGLMKPLLDTDPACGFTPPGLPLRMAMAHDCDLSTLYELLRGDPSVLSELVVPNEG